MTLTGTLVCFLPEDKIQSLNGIGIRYLAKPLLKAPNGWSIYETSVPPIILYH